MKAVKALGMLMWEIGAVLAKGLREAVTLDVRFLGSTIALWFGVLSFLAGLSTVAEGRDSSMMSAGMFLFLGVLAYRSRKHRILGERNSTWYRLCWEWTLMGLVLAGWSLQTHLLYRIATEPAHQMIHLMGCLAYPFAGLLHRRRLKEHRKGKTT